MLSATPFFGFILQWLTLLLFCAPQVLSGYLAGDVHAQQAAGTSLYSYPVGNKWKGDITPGSYKAVSASGSTADKPWTACGAFNS